jgi:serpin B
MRDILRPIALSLVCAACAPRVPAPPPAMPPPHAAQAVSVSLPASAPRAPLSPPVAGPEPAPPLLEELKGLAASNNAFGLELFASIHAQQGNISLSPLSLSTALTMTWAGARGETAGEMKRVLHLDGTTDEVLALNRRLLVGYQDPGLKVTLRIENRLFGEKTYSFRQAYLDSMGPASGAPLEPLDFRHDAEASRLHINAWIAESTENRIKDLIPQGEVDGDTVLLLTNAIDFVGEWWLPFLKQNTRPAPFHVTAAESKDTPTMHLGISGHRAFVRFAATDGVKLLEMPYQGGALAMTLVLPEDIDGLKAVEARLSASTLDRWIAALAVNLVDVALPSFEINAATPLSLGPTLAALGMPLAFDAGKADFSGIAALRAPRLHLSRAFHKAFIKLDEKGTEAAAATALVAEGRSRRGKPKLEFHADHPFLFFLRDVRSGMILFMGRVQDPTKK